MKKNKNETSFGTEGETNLVDFYIRHRLTALLSGDPDRDVEEWDTLNYWLGVLTQGRTMEDVEENKMF